MTYQEALDFLYQQFPAYQKLGKAAYKADLNNIRQLCGALGNPQDNQKFIHIAGTNGKGSTVHLTASVLQEYGLKVGVYTSPHIKDFRERIKINGQYISEKYVVDFTKRIKPLCKTIEPSFFEITFAMSLCYFKEEKTAVNIIEVGLGGRLDATNIIVPEVCAITNISLDHVNILGNSVEAIAKEKAGIIKSKIPVCLGKMKPEAKEVIEQIAIEQNASIHHSEMYDGALPIFGKHQLDNAGLAKEITSIYLGEYDDKLFQRGFLNVFENTNFIGRGQIIKENPTIIFDGAHNEDGVSKLIAEIEQMSFTKVYAIYGTSSDKDFKSILEKIPQDWSVTLSTFSNPRSANMENLKKVAKEIGIKYDFTSTPKQHLTNLKSKVKESDLILVFGSFFLLEEFY